MHTLPRSFTRIFPPRRKMIPEPTSTSQPHRPKSSRPSMPSKNLLRHLFRDLHPRSNTARQNDPASTSTSTSTSTAPTLPLPPSVTLTLTPKKTTTPPTPPAPPLHSPPSYPLSPSPLEDIAEESDTDTDDTITITDIETETASLTSDSTNKSNVAPTSTPIPSTQHLLHTAIHEAQSALRAHLHTLATSLALLDALHGFSHTITLLKREMESAHQLCVQRLRVMEEEFGEELGLEEEEEEEEEFY